MASNTTEPAPGRFQRLTDKCMALWSYLDTGIWSDQRRKWWINVLKTINLSVKSFLNRDIQTQACAMTYRTLLAVVPALALLLAIGRGFGMQEVLQEELFKIFPAQHVAVQYAMNFVDSYLTQASEGVFLGVGIAFLLYTLIALLGNVEDTFNYIWGQKNGRSIWRKISDYTATLLILPVLMLCASGLSLLLNSTLDAVFHFKFLTPLVSMFIECGKWLMTFLFFTAAYMLIPNTKVKFVNAFISGVIAGTGFLVLQWLFVTGTLYVTRYNAIYGSFAFLPLLLLWIQLAWVICLAGAVVCYSSQNLFAFSLDHEVSNISRRYESEVTVALAAVFAQRFVEGGKPLTAHDLMNYYGFPARLVTDITDTLVLAGILNRVVTDEKDVFGFQLCVNPDTFTVEKLMQRLYTEGSENFIPGFRKKFSGIESVFLKIDSGLKDITGDILLTDIKINNITPKP